MFREKTIKPPDENAKSAPTMLSLRQTAGMTGLSYSFLKDLCQENRIVHLKCGTKYLANYEKLIDYMNTTGKDGAE